MLGLGVVIAADLHGGSGSLNARISSDVSIMPDKRSSTIQERQRFFQVENKA